MTTDKLEKAHALLAASMEAIMTIGDAARLAQAYLDGEGDRDEAKDALLGVEPACDGVVLSIAAALVRGRDS